jgi:hypothetical protein
LHSIYTTLHYIALLKTAQRNVFSVSKTSGVRKKKHSIDEPKKKKIAEQGVQVQQIRSPKTTSKQDNPNEPFAAPSLRV